MDTCRLEARPGRVLEPLHKKAGEVYMRIQRQRHADGSLSVTLLEDDGDPIAVVYGFLRHLAARDCSPNTLVAYAYDLRHLWMFLAGHGLAWPELRPRHALERNDEEGNRCEEPALLSTAVLFSNPGGGLPMTHNSSRDGGLCGQIHQRGKQARQDDRLKLHRYDRRRVAGDRHTAAQRHLLNRFLGCLYYCLQTGQTYAEDLAFPTAQPIAA
jgi:hypothetical protein